MSAEDYLALRQTPLHKLNPAERIEFCNAAALWLRNAEPWIRDDATERLATAVLWESYPKNDPDAPPESHYVERAVWLLGAIDAANAFHHDVVPSFVRHLRFSTPRRPQMPLVLAWLDRLERQPPPGLDPNLAFGVRLLLDNDLADCSQLLALLDHPSDWVRGCAAMKLGNWADEDTTPTLSDFFAIIGDKELARPGVAGPFWSEFHSDGDNDGSVTLWMMELLERRNGPAPPFEAMPSNDIEFYLHELCSFSPDMVDRMLAGGFVDLALMTATEMLECVEGMQPRLETLARNPDPAIASAASRHLERFYSPS